MKVYYIIQPFISKLKVSADSSVISDEGVLHYSTLY